MKTRRARTLSGPLCVRDQQGVLRLGAGREPALVTRRGVRVNEALSRGAVEQAHGGEALLGSGARRLCPLEGRAERGPLRAIAGGRCASLSHVLLRGRDIRHVVSPVFPESAVEIEPRTFPAPSP